MQEKKTKPLAGACRNIGTRSGTSAGRPRSSRVSVGRGGTRRACSAEDCAAHPLRCDRASSRRHSLGIAVFDRRDRRRPRQADHDQADHQSSSRSRPRSFDRSMSQPAMWCMPARRWRRSTRRSASRMSNSNAQNLRRSMPRSSGSKPNSRSRLHGDRRQLVGRTAAGAAVRTAARLLCRPASEFRAADRRPGRHDRSRQGPGNDPRQPA